MALMLPRFCLVFENYDFYVPNVHVPVALLLMDKKMIPHCQFLIFNQHAMLIEEPAQIIQKCFHRLITHTI